MSGKTSDKELRRNKIRKQKMRQRLWKYKQTLQCEICQESLAECLDFHHVGKKDFSIARAVRGGYSMETILDEMDKCMVLCKNCHAKIHCRRNKDGTMVCGGPPGM